jgi:predicted enzyme related to lactoylglutathione lyase
MKDPFKTHGAFNWNELMTSDPAAAKEFYRQLLGWEMGEWNEFIDCRQKNLRHGLKNPLQA